MPPASSLFAESPVPAPPPIIGSPARDLLAESFENALPGVVDGHECASWATPSGFTMSAKLARATKKRQESASRSS